MKNESCIFYYNIRIVSTTYDSSKKFAVLAVLLICNSMPKNSSHEINQFHGIIFLLKIFKNFREIDLLYFTSFFVTWTSYGKCDGGDCCSSDYELR